MIVFHPLGTGEYLDGPVDVLMVRQQGAGGLDLGAECTERVGEYVVDLAGDPDPLV